jgi:hypothetical protein
MKSTFAALSSILISAAVCFSQQEGFPARFEASQTASVIPNLSFYVSGGTSLMSQGNRVFRGDARLGIADAIELGISRREESVDFLGKPRLNTRLELKLRILESTETQPSVALAFNTSLGMDRQELWEQDIDRIHPAYAAQGLNGTRFDYSLSTAQVIVTQPVFADITTSVGFGVQEFQYTGVWVFIDPAPHVTNGYVMQETQRELLFTGFVQACVSITQNATVFAESRSMPATRPLLDRADIAFDRVYLTSAGIRYFPVPSFALDAMISYRSPFLGIGATEARINLSTYLSIHEFIK